MVEWLLASPLSINATHFDTAHIIAQLFFQAYSRGRNSPPKILNPPGNFIA